MMQRLTFPYPSILSFLFLFAFAWSFTLGPPPKDAATGGSRNAGPKLTHRQSRWHQWLHLERTSRSRQEDGSCRTLRMRPSLQKLKSPTRRRGAGKGNWPRWAHARANHPDITFLGVLRNFFHRAACTLRGWRRRIHRVFVWPTSQLGRLHFPRETPTWELRQRCRFYLVSQHALGTRHSSHAPSVVAENASRNLICFVQTADRLWIRSQDSGVLINFQSTHAAMDPWSDNCLSVGCAAKSAPEMTLW